MSEKKRSRRRKDEYSEPGEPKLVKPSNDEIKVAKWMKKNVKTKRTKFLNHNVEYFTSNKAIDALLKSSFASGEGALFSNREAVVDFLDLMLEHKFFHRAKKVPINPEVVVGQTKTVKSKEEKKEEKSSTPKNKDKDKEKEKDNKAKDNEKSAEDKKDTEGEDANGGEESGNGNGGDKRDQKKKRKIRLDMHPQQIFVDGSEAYVWIYDPVPVRYWIYGFLVLLGSIGICLFPLWPPMLRLGVYYLSMAGVGFIIFILVLTLLRLIIFSIVWGVTGGKVNLWILPNLTEDVGFFASFWPLYELKFSNDEEKSKSDKKAKSKNGKKKAKDSDAEDDAAAEEDEVPLEPEKIEEIKEHDADVLLRHRPTAAAAPASAAAVEQIDDKAAASAKADAEDSSNSSVSAAESDAKGSVSPSESESEISGKDYEIIQASEVQNVK